MAGEVVEHRERPAVLAIDAQDADLRVDRPDALHLVIGRQRVRPAHVDLASVLQRQPAILADSILLPGARPTLTGVSACHASLTACTVSSSVSPRTACDNGWR